MTEKEKMVAGLWHRANDPGLIQERKSAKSLLFELQQLHPSKEKERVSDCGNYLEKADPISGWNCRFPVIMEAIFR